MEEGLARAQRSVIILVECKAGQYNSIGMQTILITTVLTLIDS